MEGRLIVYTSTELSEMSKEKVISIFLSHQRENNPDVHYVKSYLDGKIDFETLLKEVSGCLPYACSWCTDCSECDLQNLDDKKRCRTCAKRCLAKLKEDDL